MQQNQLLTAALAAFERETGLALAVLQREPALPDDRCGDTLLQLDGTGLHLRFCAVVKTRAAQINPGALANQLRQFCPPHEGLLVTDFINPRMAERLKAAAIQFIDTAGNAYLNRAPLYVLVKGNRHAMEELRDTQVTGRAFKQAGLKVVFALLRDPDLVNAPYREIAKRARVALGNIGWIINDLTNLGFVEQALKAPDKKLIHGDKLLAKWIEEYPVTLRQKLVLGKFTTGNPAWFEQIDPAEFDACWGGELAAFLQAGYLTPCHAIVYMDKRRLNEFLLAARLKKKTPGRTDEQDILILEKFWNDANGKIQDTLAPPILTYADLIETGDPRNLEAAARIHEQQIA